MTYDPNLGRWLEVDPTGFDAGDMNLYRMEGNNPANEVDPSGLETPSSSNPDRWGPASIPEWVLRQRAIEQAFYKAAEKNNIPGSVIAKILATYKTTWVFPFWTNRCAAWTDTFQVDLGKTFGNPEFWPLKGTGLKGGIVSWKVTAYGGATDSHSTYEIVFPDGTVYLF